MSKVLLLSLLLVAMVLLVLTEEERVLEQQLTRSGNMFNFASHSAGAVILDKSPSTATGFSNLLNDDKDKYGISSCDLDKWIVIGLSEDILVSAVALANYEKYSSTVRDFQLLAASSYPTDEWIDLGTYTAEPRLGEQLFQINDKAFNSVHTRYLMIKFLTHYFDESLCTLSQVKVFGMTVIASFKQEVERSDSIMRDVLHHLSTEEEDKDYVVTVISDGNTIDQPDNSTEVASKVQSGHQEEAAESSNSTVEAVVQSMVASDSKVDSDSKTSDSTQNTISQTEEYVDNTHPNHEQNSDSQSSTVKATSDVDNTTINDSINSKEAETMNTTVNSTVVDLAKHGNLREGNNYSDNFFNFHRMNRTRIVGEPTDLITSALKTVREYVKPLIKPLITRRSTENNIADIAPCTSKSTDSSVCLCVDEYEPNQNSCKNSNPYTDHAPHPSKQFTKVPNNFFTYCAPADFTPENIIKYNEDSEDPSEGYQDNSADSCGDGNIIATNPSSDSRNADSLLDSNATVTNSNSSDNLVKSLADHNSMPNTTNNVSAEVNITDLDNGNTTVVDASTNSNIISKSSSIETMLEPTLIVGATLEKIENSSLIGNFSTEILSKFEEVDIVSNSSSIDSHSSLNVSIVPIFDDAINETINIEAGRDVNSTDVRNKYVNTSDGNITSTQSDSGTGFAAVKNNSDAVTNLTTDAHGSLLDSFNGTNAENMQQDCSENSILVDSSSCDKENLNYEIVNDGNLSEFSHNRNENGANNSEMKLGNDSNPFNGRDVTITKPASVDANSTGEPALIDASIRQSGTFASTTTTLSGTVVDESALNSNSSVASDVENKSVSTQTDLVNDASKDNKQTVEVSVDSNNVPVKDENKVNDPVINSKTLESTDKKDRKVEVVKPEVMVSSTEGLASPPVTVGVAALQAALNSTLPYISANSPNLVHCIENLKFNEFHNKMLAKLQKSNAMDFDGVNIQGSSKDNNVFRMLMQKIKTMEMNNAIVEKFTIQMSDCYRVAVLDLMNRVSIVSVPDPIADNAVFVQDNDSNHFSETDLSNSKHDVWKHSMALPRKKFHRSSQEEKPIPIVTFQDLWEELPSCLSTTDFKIGESCWQSVELFIHQNLAVMLLVLLGTTLTSVGIIFLLLLFIVVRTMRRT